MRITIHATVENADASSAPQVVRIGEVARDAGADPASGLGLFVREANALLRQIQSVVLNEQADEFIRVAAECLACGRRLDIKDTKSLVYRTVYGKATQASRSTPVGTRVLAALINAQVPGSRTALSRHELLGIGARAPACLRWSATSGAAQAVKPIQAGRLAPSAVWWE